MSRYLLPLVMLFAASCVFGADTPSLHHDLLVVIDPNTGQLKVEDDITLPANTKKFEFSLNAGLKLDVTSSDQASLKEQSRIGELTISHYQIAVPEGETSLSLKYQGKINHKLRSTGAAIEGGRQYTQGFITDGGVFLGGSSYWVPYSTDYLNQFNLTVTLPGHWRSISQGLYNTESNQWINTTPQDEIYLIAGPYKHYSSRGEVALAEAYLLNDDKPLADKYLNSTHHWLSFYQALLGDYPYPKFALVENFWQSGYGMPSFTLLGSRVIRFPFILYSSFPHEILHNWWGNGVYVNYQEGNWSEGLTTYLADHLIKEQQGKGLAYRRKSLIDYANRVNKENDFPISSFRSNLGHRSQSIGYGKTMMFFHMLRRLLGDEMFIRGLQRFYSQGLFIEQGFSDLKAAFEQASGRPLTIYFNQWLDRTGAPKLVIEGAQVQPADDGYQLNVRIAQSQDGAPYQLSIPYLVQFADGSHSGIKTTPLHTRSMEIREQFSKQPVKFLLDPQFDLFRILDRDEIPSSLSQLFSSEKLHIILPSGESDSMTEAYRLIADTWSRNNPKVTILRDHQIKTLPKGEVWILGDTNRFSGSYTDLARKWISKDPGSSVILTQRDKTGGQQTSGFLRLGSVHAAPGLARKLPHYGKYSYLAFEGDAPSNTDKGEWLVNGRNLSRSFVSDDAELPMLELSLQPALAPLPK